MYSLLVILFVIVCILLVITILMQASKGGGLASSFGGMGSAGGVLGARGAASFLQKVTIGLGISYGILCLIISLLSKPATELPESQTQERIRSEQPAVPGPSAPPVSEPSQGQGSEQEPIPDDQNQ